MFEPWEQVDRAGEWLLELENEFAPDLIHLNGYVHAAIAWEAPVLVVAHSCVCSWWRAVQCKPIPAGYDIYQRRVWKGLQSADHVVAPSRAMMRALHQEYGSLPSEEVIYNGRDATGFRPGFKSPVILTAGRVEDPAKNIELLDGIAKDLEWPIHVAGEFTEHSAMPNVRSLGKLTQPQMREVLASASLYAAPAVYEPFGLGILEAALSGCALVLSDIPSLREIWGDAAVFVSPRDPEAWSHALNLLSEDSELREEFAARSLVRARNFPASGMVRSYLGAYAGILSPQRSEVLV
jgi:glycosyltransferase involved in cell wall biosynthesis